MVQVCLIAIAGCVYLSLRKRLMQQTWKAEEKRRSFRRRMLGLNYEDDDDD